METSIEALRRLGSALIEHEYRFVTPTPETHRRVNGRAHASGAPDARTLRDVFGWSRSFQRGALPRAVVDLAFAAGVLVEDGERLRATVRFSTLGRHIFVHSAYPTVDTDSVFFGPDTYRFCKLIARTLGGAKRARRLVDIGCGSGAGGIIASSYADRIVLTDVNHAALFHSKVNTRLAGVEAHAEIIESDILAAIEGPFDVVTANPPYLVDPGRRAYRDGGGSFGEGLAIRMVEQSLERLEPGGRLILYTGAAIVAGTDTFLEAVRPVCEGGGCTWSYDELDPDVFGEEIELNDSYAAADRIAAVALVAHKSLDR